MLALRELQAAMRAALLDGQSEDLPREIVGDGLDPKARLEIYRHHVLTTLTAALEATYPAVCRLVDRRFFAYAARYYIQEHPPEGPCLFEYGATFPDFLAVFPPCGGHAYLPDVARLEWAVNAALYADDAVPLDAGRLASVAAEDAPRLTFRLHPSLAWLASRWPVDRIWQANRGGAPEEIVDLDAGGVRLEVRRVRREVTLRALDPGPYAFRGALGAGQALECAARSALALDPSFDLARALHDILQEELAIDFAVSSQDEKGALRWP